MTRRPDADAPDRDADLHPLERIAQLLADRIAPALERIALALERAPEKTAPAPAPADPRAAALTDLRRAIREADFPAADDLFAAFSADYPEAAEAARLGENLAAARVFALDDRRKRLDAARSANDPNGVLNARDALAAMLPRGELDPLDRELVSWLMGVLMKRMRTGTVGGDVANLAARVAESFAHRPEGASLRASLPTLRRSAGLCARCGEPYRGDEDACPKCVAAALKIAEIPETPGSPT